MWLSLLGISWFWFLGAIYLSKLPTYASAVLGGDASVYTLLMTLFSLGVGIGSMLCERLSGSKVELGLVPFGSLGLCLFGIDLYFATPAVAAQTLDWLATGADELAAGLAAAGFPCTPGFRLLPKEAKPQTDADRTVATSGRLDIKA